MTGTIVDVAVIGGGPAGLGAALALARGKKKVLLCDAGPRRNAAAEHMHGFVSREPIPPAEFRKIAREQLAPYDVTLRDVGVRSVAKIGSEGFEVALADGSTVRARRVLLATGMVDEVPDIPGMRELWGRTVFQCPYCHGWEVLDRKWAILATRPEHFEFAIFSTGWTPQLVAFTNGARDIPAEVRKRLERAGVALEPRKIRRLVGTDGMLTGVELEDGVVVDAGVLIVRPPQRQVALVERLGVALDENGFVKTDAAGQTSIPGIYAAGDISTPMQAALLAAAAGTRAAYALNHAMNLARGEAAASSSH